jgi:hypothetical protein
MRQISFIVSDSGVFTAFVNGKTYTFNKEHPHYNDAKRAIKEDNPANLDEALDITSRVQDFVQGHVEVKAGVVYYKGEAIHNVLTDRILNLMREDLPFEPMLKFLENLMENPSMASVQELYSFLAHRNLPITEDGCFLAYKSVNAEYKDWHTGKIDNSIGQKPSMVRNKVSDNRSEGCSQGLHVGAIEYVSGFHRDDGKLIVVKVNPKDVVSVPLDANETKMRVCTYEVLREYVGELTASPLYSSVGNPVVSHGYNHRFL